MCLDGAEQPADDVRHPQQQTGLLRVYRRWGWMFLAVVLLLVMFGIGVGMAVAPEGTGVSGRVTGAVVAAVIGFAIWRTVTTRVEVTAEQIVYYGGIRKRSVRWASVAALETVRRDMVTPWYVLEVVTSEGRRVRLESVSGLKAYVESVVQDLQSLQPK